MTYNLFGGTLNLAQSVNPGFCSFMFVLARAILLRFKCMCFFDRLKKAAWYIISAVSDCMYVCLSEDTFPKVGSGQSLFPQCKASISHNSGSIRDTAVKFVS